MSAAFRAVLQIPLTLLLLLGLWLWSWSSFLLKGHPSAIGFETELHCQGVGAGLMDRPIVCGASSLVLQQRMMSHNSFSLNLSHPISFGSLA